MTKPKTYLGDGVYVEIDNYDDIILTTEDGYITTNRILLDQSVLDNLMDYLKNKNGW